MTEVLRSTCGRYHDLLAADLQARMSAAVESDVLGELDIRTPAQHRQVVDDYCLPWQLEGAGACVCLCGRQAGRGCLCGERLSAGHGLQRMCGGGGGV